MATVLRSDILSYAVSVVSRLYPDFSYADIQHAGRNYSITRARSLLWAMLHGTGMWSLTQISSMTNRSTPPTVLKGIRSIKERHGVDLVKIYSEELKSYVAARASLIVTKQNVRRDTPQDGASSSAGD